MDATWSVRISDDMKDKISSLITESGLNSKEFLAQIIQIYELKTTKNLQPLMESDINKLNQITGRINNIFINLCEKFTTFQRQKEEEFNFKIGEKDSILGNFNRQIENYELRISEYEKKSTNLKNHVKETQEQYINLCDLCESNKALIQEYREKNESLSKLLDKHKECKDILDNMKKELESEIKNRKIAEDKLLMYDNNVKQLEKLLREAQESSQIELNNKLELFQIQKEKDILSIKKEYQKNLASIQEEYARKIKDFLDITDVQKKLKTTVKKIPKQNV